MSQQQTVREWRAKAAQIEPRTQLFIEGASVVGRADPLPAVNPTTGECLAEVSSADELDVDSAVASARSAFADGRWSRLAPDERKAILLRVAAAVLDHADELALLDTLDAGKLIADTTSIDVPGSAAILSWYAEALDKSYGEIAPTGGGDLALITREPLGVVGAVVPWNYPLEMAIWKLAPALAVGNSVVLKPAEDSPLSALRFAELATAAGLPPGVLNVIPGAGAIAGQALGRHEHVDVLTFTGSTAVGKLFQRYAGESNMKQVWLECGGKSANVVFGDVADLDAVADGVVFGILTNQGQVCSANSRLLVARSVKDELLDRVIDRIRDRLPGDPLDPATTFGPMVSTAHAEQVRRYIEIGRHEADLVHLGVTTGASSAAYVGAAIFDNVAPTSRIATEEVFGPLLAVTTFEDESQAVALANGTPYALAASLWTDDLRRAHRVAGQLHAGTVSVNTVDALSVTTPFGGFGLSGYGRDLSLHAVDKFTGLKTTWFKNN